MRSQDDMSAVLRRWGAAFSGGSREVGLRRWWPWAVVGLWIVTCWVLLHGPLALGPHRWDDSRYVSRAVLGVYDAGIRDRYVHVWGLRAFHQLIDSPLQASLHYGASMTALLIGLAFALGQRAGGTVCGLLSAVLVVLYPPVLRYASAPMSDAPSVVYGGFSLLAVMLPAPGRARVALTVVSGVLSFCAYKCKESGVTVLPALLWVLLERQRGVRGLLPWVAGVAVGQVGLCLVDWLITGDPLPSLKGGQAKKYVKLLTREPFRYRGSKNLMRHEWLGLLLGPGLRGFAFAGIGGLVVRTGLSGSEGPSGSEARRSTVRALALWGVTTLLFYGFVTYRYSGIDARIRYLIAFALPLSVGASLLIISLWQREQGAFSDLSRVHQRLYAGGVLLAVFFVYRGLDAGLSRLYAADLGLARARAHYFLLPLLLPLAWFVTWTAPWRLLRRVSAGLLVVATVLTAMPLSIDYLREHRAAVTGWHVLGRKADAQGAARFAHLRNDPIPLNRDLVVWRMHALSRQKEVRQRLVRRPAGLAPGEWLVVSKAKLAQAEAAGLQPLTVLEINGRRHHVLRAPAPSAPD